MTERARRLWHGKIGIRPVYDWPACVTVGTARGEPLECTLEGQTEAEVLIEADEAPATDFSEVDAAQQDALRASWRVENARRAPSPAIERPALPGGAEAADVALMAEIETVLARHGAKVSVIEAVRAAVVGMVKPEPIKEPLPDEPIGRVR
jgi:hypothetical protein